MSKRIYVGNLPWSVTKVVLENLFSGFGEIEEALVIANKFTGRSRGFGFVTFKEDHSAEKAIKEMHEKDVEGRKLVVREAMPMGERAKREGEKGHPHERRERAPRRKKNEESEEEFE